MKRSALILHLVLKDLRFQRAWLVLLWLLALLLPLLALSLSPGPIKNNPFMTGATGGFEFLYLVILLRIVHLDPPGRGTHFLATRPVDWFSLLASKVLFASAFLLVPTWMATLGTMYALGVQSNVLDQALLLIEVTISTAALFSVVAVPAFFLRRLISVMMALAGGAALLGIGSLVIANYVNRSVTPPPDPTEFSYQLDRCRWLMFELGLAGTGMVAAFLCYGKRPLRESLVTIGGGLFVSLMCWLYWPVNLSVIFSDRPPQVTELAPALRDKIQFHVWNGPEHPAFMMSTGRNNHIVLETVNLPGGLSGTDAPYFINQAGFRAEATLRSGGRLLPSHLDDDLLARPVLDTVRAGDNLRQKLAGFAPMWGWPRRWQDEAFSAFNYVPDRYRDEDLTGASIKGVVTFTIGRAFILRTLPLQAGTVFNLPRRRYTVQQVEADASRISFHLVKQYMPLTLRGDAPGWQEWENLSWLVINRRKGEYLIDNGAEGYGDYLEIHHLERPVLLNGVTNSASVKAGFAQAKEPIPADWIDDAEIVFFSSDSCGQISFPYEIPHIDLLH